MYTFRFRGPAQWVPTGILSVLDRWEVDLAEDQECRNSSEECGDVWVCPGCQMWQVEVETAADLLYALEV